jgi:hypothetical protein
MNHFVTRAAAAMAAVILTACGATPHGTTVEPTRTVQHDGRPFAAFAHGAEIESAQNVIVNEGNTHMAFPPGATVKRTGSGIEVTFRGVTRTFSSSARVETGTYRKFAKAQ